MFLILNNEIAFNKQILRVYPPPKNETPYTSFSDISASGYTTGQIFKTKDTTLVINGVIKNLNKLAQKMFAPPSLEVLLVLYEKYGFEYMLRLLEGEFSIILLDHNLNKANSKLYVAQDRLGLCPLYVFTEETPADRKIIAFANTVKQLQLESILYETRYNIQQFEPGTYSQYEYPFKVLSYWKPLIQNVRYAPSWPKNWLTVDSKSQLREEFLKTVEVVKNALYDSIAMDLAICKKTLSSGFDSESTILSDLDSPSQPLPNVKRTTDYRASKTYTLFVPPPNPSFGKIGCLLSGGVDSSLIASLIRDHLRLQDYNPDEILHTFTMGFEGSADLKNAKEVIEYIGGTEQHTEFLITEDAYITAIPVVIEILETADIATLRYGIALYLMLSHIHDKTQIRDIFTGDGADEAMGGFLNFFYMTNPIEHDYECNHLLKTYHKSGALYRKLFDHFGMRWYRPFLNDVWLSRYMTIPMDFRYEVGSIMTFPNMGYEFDKDLLRVAFSWEHYKTAEFKELLPKQILWRTSEPGYDGISSYYRQLRHIIEENLAAMPDAVANFNSELSNNPIPAGISEPIRELDYYRSIYRQHFPNMKDGELGNVPPYKFAKTTYEPTMRNLNIYLEFHLEYQDRTV